MREWKIGIFSQESYRFWSMVHWQTEAKIHFVYVTQKGKVYKFLQRRC